MRRVWFVGFTPNAIFMSCTFALVRAGCFTGDGRWARVPPRTAGEAVALGLLICACAAVAGLLLNPFQIRAVRLLEGYWALWRPTARLGAVLVEYQRRKWLVAAERARGDAAPDVGERALLPLTEQIREHDRKAEEERRRGVATRWLAVMPPQEVLLPTALGNALRAGELSAGERYGLTTLTSWPRIYPQVREPLAGMVRSARDMLDTSVNLCHAFLACALVLGFALWDEPEGWWLPTGSGACAVLAYQGAVVAARSYVGLMHVVYDLHRFDLVRALRYRLPDRDGEWPLFQSISDVLLNRETDLQYQHGASDPDEADGSAHA